MVSRVGVGCNAFGARIDQEQTSAVVSAALDSGITLFDTADSYGDGLSETYLGRALGSRREDVVVATKLGMGEHDAEHFGAHGSRRYVRRAVEASLRRLGTDYIDLYQLHRPDPGTPVEETLGAMSELVTEGKVLYLGSSNFAAWQVADADWVARTRGSEPVRQRAERVLALQPPRRDRAGPGVRAVRGRSAARTSPSRTGCSPASTAWARWPRQAVGSRSRRHVSRVRAGTGSRPCRRSRTNVACRC